MEGGVMKIMDKNPYINLDAYTSNVKAARDQDRPSKSSSTAVPGGDKVVLSPRAREIQELRKKLAEMPGIREDLVAELKERVESGKYEVDSVKLAGKMLEDVIV
jgi:negative regulator of flagellin synthesis FlgM